MHHFPILYLLLSLFYLFIFFWGGGRSKLSIMIATLKKNRMEQPPSHPIPFKTRIIYVKAITCHLFGGDGGS